MKKVLSFFCVMALSFFTVTSVNAVSIAEAGDTVEQVGEYDSTRIVAGNTVINKADVDGLSFIAGNDITLEGSTPYGFYAGNNVVVNENVKKDMFIAGNNITIGDDAIVGRDAYIAGNIITIGTDITRDLRAAGDTVDIRGIVIGGDAYITADDILMDESTVIVGNLTVPDTSNIDGRDQASIGSMEVIEQTKVVVEYNFADMVRDFIVSSAAAFIVGVVLFFIIPSSKEKLDNTELDASSIVKKSLIGLAVLVTVPLVALIALFTGILTPLSLITIVFYIIAIYLSGILVSYIIGKLVASKLFKNDNVYLALVTGIVLVKLVKYVPIIGGLVGIVSLLYGLGLIFKFVFMSKKNI